MADLPTLENALRNADAAGDTYAAGRFAQEIRAMRGSGGGAAIAKEAAQSLPYQMGQAGAQPAQSLPSYAAQSLIEGAPSTAGAIAGSPGGYPGMMAGAGLGDVARQAAHSITHPSVMPGVGYQSIDLDQAATTAALTGIIPATAVGASKVLGGLKDKFAVPVMDLIKQGGEKDLATKYIRDKVLGEKGLARVLEAAKEAKEIIPGHKPTMAQAVGHLPEASPLQAYQMINAKSPLGVSGAYGEREAKQRVAEAVAERYANKMTVPKGLEALDKANAQGGVPIKPILDDLEKRLTIPEVQGAPKSEDALKSIKDFLTSRADANGNINARTLYQFKKEGIDQVVDAAMEKVSPKVSEGFKAVNLIQMKKAIDDAIETGGGAGWKAYNKEYAGRMDAIERAVMNRESQYKPLQKTNLSEPEVDKLRIANVLDRPITYINSLVSYLRGDIQPKIHAEAQRRLLDKDIFIEEMRKVPPRYRPMIEALMKQTGGVAGAQMGSQLRGITP